MLFSVLIANYNNGVFFEDCYKSILAQTYDNWEIIIVDDCSTDDSVEKIKKIVEGDNRVKIFVNKENKGCGYTKNKCSEYANGEICGFVDPDDALTKDALQLSVEAHIKNKNASLVYSTNYICDEYLNVLNVNPHVKKQPEGVELIDNCFVGHFVSYKNELYKKSEGTNPLNLRAIDHDLYFLLEELGDVVYIDKPLYYYRHHSASISLNENNYKAHYWDWVIRHHYALKRGRNLETEFSKYMDGRVFLGAKYSKLFKKYYSLYLNFKR